FGEILDVAGEANDIGIDPPAALLRQKFVTKEVCECGRRSFAGAVLIDEVFFRRENLRRIADTHAGRNMKLGLERVELEGMTVIDERSQAQNFVWCESLARPERLK